MPTTTTNNYDGCDEYDGDDGGAADAADDGEDTGYDDYDENCDSTHCSNSQSWAVLQHLVRSTA